MRVAPKARLGCLARSHAAYTGGRLRPGTAGAKAAGARVAPAAPEVLPGQQPAVRGRDHSEPAGPETARPRCPTRDNRAQGAGAPERPSRSGARRYQSKRAGVSGVAVSAAVTRSRPAFLDA
jgi:hypothetical protein